MLQYEIIPVTPFQQNCTLFWCARTREGVVIDPGGEAARIIEVIKKNNIDLVKVLLTHAHVDHAGAAHEIANYFNIPIIGPHKADQFWIDIIPEQKARFGFEDAQMFSPDQWLEHGDVVKFGSIELDVYFCPGHTPGHVVFYHKNSKLAQVGDVLFRGSIGRTDFPKGDHATLIKSIRTHLFPLGDDVNFIPGHGSMSTFGEERMSNPFVSDSVLGIYSDD